MKNSNLDEINKKKRIADYDMSHYGYIILQLLSSYYKNNEKILSNINKFKESLNHNDVPNNTEVSIELCSKNKIDILANIHIDKRQKNYKNFIFNIMNKKLGFDVTDHTFKQLAQLISNRLQRIFNFISHTILGLPIYCLNYEDLGIQLGDKSGNPLDCENIIRFTLRAACEENGEITKEHLISAIEK